MLGYAFLEESDDTRNTPAQVLIDFLKRAGVNEISVHDPFVRKEDYKGLERDVYDALTRADCACVMTGHRVYYELDYNRWYAQCVHHWLSTAKCHARWNCR